MTIHGRLFRPQSGEIVVFLRSRPGEVGFAQSKLRAGATEFGALFVKRKRLAGVHGNTQSQAVHVAEYVVGKVMVP